MSDTRVFADRRDAGRRLAEELRGRAHPQPVVLALPRGGVTVADEVAKALQAPLDVVLVRKVGAPMQPELALGAVVDGAQPELVVNEDVRRLVGVSDAELEAVKRRELAVIDERREAYLKGRPRAAAAGRTAIVVDDGIATGATTRAALEALRRNRPAKLVLATPVAPPDTIAKLRGEVDEVVCLLTPEPFHAISLYYRDFPQVTDNEVITVLEAAAQQRRRD